MKRAIYLLTGLLLVMLLGACGKSAEETSGSETDGENMIYVTDSPSYVIDIAECYETEDGYRMVGIKRCDNEIYLTSEQKDLLDSGEIITGIYNGKEIFRLSLRTDGEGSQEPYELTELTGTTSVALLDRTEGWLVSGPSMGKYVVLEQQCELTVPADMMVEVTNYYIYDVNHQSSSPDASERQWTMEKYYEDWLKPSGLGNTWMRVEDEDGEIRLIERYLP